METSGNSGMCTYSKRIGELVRLISRAAFEMFTRSLIIVLFIHLECLAQVRKAPLLISSVCFGVFFLTAYQVHNPNCSSASRATNYANRTCVELKENLQREATKDQLAFSLWKSVFLKKLLEARMGPMSGKFNFSFTSPHLANTSHSQVLNYFLIGLSILYTIAIVFFLVFFIWTKLTNVSW